MTAPPEGGLPPDEERPNRPEGSNRPEGPSPPEPALRGYIDIHVHAAPSLFARSVNDLELARGARDAGMRGFVLKAHEESTVSRAELLRLQFPGLEVFGSIVLNAFVGGLNPYAADLALRLGARIVWMPTGSAANHIAYYGGPDYAAQKASGPLMPQKGICVLDDRGKVRPEVFDIVDRIAQSDAVLATGHLSPEETSALVRLARGRGVQKVLVAHPDLGVTRMPVDLQMELAGMGAFLEKSYLPLMPDWKSATWGTLIDSIRRLGPDRCVLQTDFGQANHPHPVEAYGAFLRGLREHGVRTPDLYRMGAENPADLLGIPRI